MNTSPARANGIAEMPAIAHSSDCISKSTNAASGRLEDTAETLGAIN
jgi:hypothetical protein